jgi:hypothetical protein
MESSHLRASGLTIEGSGTTRVMYAVPSGSNVAESFRAGADWAAGEDWAGGEDWAAGATASIQVNAPIKIPEKRVPPTTLF